MTREYLHDVEHEMAALAVLAERGDKQAEKELQKIKHEYGSTADQRRRQDQS
jgi:hypothetical protein